ncbi:MAG: hypothetical protein AMXMBFR12_09390 [Candidatus Babeliales bacterium]
MNKKMIFSLFSLGLLAGGTNAQAEVKMEDTKVINVQQIVMESDAGKAAVAELQKKQQALEAQFQQLGNEMKTLQADLEKTRNDYMAKRSLMSSDAQMKEEKKIRDIERKIEELNAKAQRMMQDARNEMQMAEMQLMQPLMQEQIEVITAWAKEKNLTMVIDESSGRVIYKKDSLDATKEVIQLVNKKHEQKTALAKNKITSKPTTKIS